MYARTDLARIRWLRLVDLDCYCRSTSTCWYMYPDFWSTSIAMLGISRVILLTYHQMVAPREFESHWLQISLRSSPCGPMRSYARSAWLCRIMGCYDHTISYYRVAPRGTSLSFYYVSESHWVTAGSLRRSVFLWLYGTTVTGGM